MPDHRPIPTSCARVARTTLVTVILVGLAACGSGSNESVRGDTAAAAGATASSDTGMAGMDHGDMPGMNRPAAKDANHEFLRMMSDHHEGLIEMASAAMTKASTRQAQVDAHTLHTKQEEEQKRMISMIQQSYSESLTPMVMPSNNVMNDSLQAKSGAEYDRTFYGNVVRHHQEAIRMIDQFLPRLTNAEVRQMAEQMRADQRKEIPEMERKQRATS
jgi:uncharacterized protein (DUF305 family)